MRPEQLDPNLLEAQSLKIAILRLINAYGTPCQAHRDDWQFDVYALVLVLGRRKTPESREALLDLLDFQLTDTVFDAITTVVGEDRSVYMPLLSARIGKPPCAEALREKPYVRPMPPEYRDRDIRNWSKGIGG